MATKRRQERIAEYIQEIISELVLMRVKDPRLGNVTITSAEITRDLGLATVWYTVLGDQEETDQAKEGLASDMGFIRREMGTRLRLRHTPELVFKRDDSWERGSRIDALLERIALEREE